MAESEQEEKQTVIQVKLPPEMSTLFDDLKAVRAKNFETLTITSIVIDAVKEYHRKRVSGK